MKGSWQLGTAAGIGVYVHWTFALLIGWILVSYLSQGDDLAVAVRGVLFVLAVFGCIVLHELGHALMARRYKVRTRDITLYPIGGVARLERIPDVPVQELWIALAGPAVNVVIVAVLMGVYYLQTGMLPKFTIEHLEESFMLSLLLTNIVLVFFNMVPAFPMDGGRVLRALLSLRLNYVKATRIAAAVGQGLAVLFGVYAIYRQQPMWVLISLFVYFGAQKEVQDVQLRALFQGIRVCDAMITNFSTLLEEDTLAKAAEKLLGGTQQDFPVVSGQRIVGLLPRNVLVKGLSERGQDARVRQVMIREFESVEESTPMDTAFQKMKESGCATLPVQRNGELAGLLTAENLSELLMVQSALKHAGVPEGMG